MRKRSLSDKGVQLYLNANIQRRPKRWYQYMICNLYYSDYDDKMFDILRKSRKSTQALCAEFGCPQLSRRLDAGVYNTIQIILKHKKDYTFFLDVMWSAFQQQDHQTAHMLYLALTNKALKHIHIPKRALPWFTELSTYYGSPIYEKHVHYWRSVRSDQTLPSVIAFHNFVRRRKFMQRNFEAREAEDFMEIFKYLEHYPKDILPVYSPAGLQNSKTR